MSVCERGSTYGAVRHMCRGLRLNFETILPIADALFERSIDFIAWQPNVISTRKNDGTPVSESDKIAQTLVTAILNRFAPNIPVRGEEDDLRQVLRYLLVGAYWLVDPIDGTRFYDAMMYEWCVSVALMVGGEPLVGIILQPGRGEAYVGIKGQGIYMRTLDTQWKEFARRPAVNQVIVVPTSLSVMSNRVLNDQAVRLTVRYENTTSTPSVLAGLQIVRGHAWGWASLFRPWSWDIAGIYVLTGEIGGSAMCADGTPIDFKQDRLPPVVFTAPYKKGCDAAGIMQVLHGDHAVVPR